MPNCIHCHQPQTAASVICPECYRALTERTEKMVQNLTCFKCHHDTAVLTYEENRIYKVSCPCGCEYSFEHSSMNCAQSYHMREVELHGEIDRNADLRAQLTEAERQRAAAVYDLKYASDENHTCLVCKHYEKDPCPGCERGDCFEWRGAQEAGEGGAS